jgi:hypothetical protein
MLSVNPLLSTFERLTQVYETCYVYHASHHLKSVLPKPLPHSRSSHVTTDGHSVSNVLVSSSLWNL